MNNIINQKARIGKNVKIDPFTIIHEDVEIGEGSWIGSNVTIFPGARIGKNCQIYPGSVIASSPQDLKFNNEKTIAKIGDNSIIREYVTINKGTAATKKTEVGENCFIMAYCHIAHDCIVGHNCIIANAVNLAGHVTIENNVVMGGLCAVKQFLNIGKYCMISGGSLIRKDVPPFIKVAKEPIKFIGINIIGLTRNNFSEKKIKTIKNSYRILAQKGYNTSQAISILEKKENLNKEEKEIINFINKSKNGIIKF